MEQPTEEQIREFWEWCADRWESFNEDKHRHYLFGEEWVEDEPPIDLNSLFKYAVPKVNELGYTVRINQVGLERIWQVSVEMIDDWHHRRGVDPALPLFWAIWQVKEKQYE